MDLFRGQVLDWVKKLEETIVPDLSKKMEFSEDTEQKQTSDLNNQFEEKVERLRATRGRTGRPQVAVGPVAHGDLPAIGQEGDVNGRPDRQGYRRPGECRAWRRDFHGGPELPAAHAVHQE